ncbi:MAG: reverse transcriptase domain-containing protein [Candidatus Thiodiazotropha sp.]
MTTALQAVAYKAQTHPRHIFQNLSSLLDEDLIFESWGQLKKNVAPGIDNVDAERYSTELNSRVTTLVDKLKRGAYRANRIKRVYIDKPNGGQRPLGLPTLEDKLVQQSVAQLLSSIYEADFLPNSYGYRPNRSAHGAIHSLRANLQFKGYGYIVEADIKGFFDTVEHSWLQKMLAQRIDDQRLVSLIGQWLKAPIVEPTGEVNKPAQGTPQGGVISPVLANIYLHYVIDLWFERVVKPRCHGRAMLIRYCDDFVVAFQLRRDAEAFYRVLPQRLSGPAWSEERSSLPDEAAVYDCALSWVAEKGFIQSDPGDPEATFEDLKASQTFAGCKESEASIPSDDPVLRLERLERFSPVDGR